MRTEISQILQQFNQIFISTARLAPPIYYYNCMLAFGTSKLHAHVRRAQARQTPGWCMRAKNNKSLHYLPGLLEEEKKAARLVIKPANGQIISSSTHERKENDSFPRRQCGAEPSGRFVHAHAPQLSYTHICI